MLLVRKKKASADHSLNFSLWVSALKIEFFKRALLAKLLHDIKCVLGCSQLAVNFTVERSKHFRSIILSFAVQRDVTKKQELDQL